MKILKMGLFCVINSPKRPELVIALISFLPSKVYNIPNILEIDKIIKNIINLNKV